MCNRLLGFWDYARMLSLLIIIGGHWPDLEPISTRNFPLITQTEYPQSNQPGGTFSRYQKKKLRLYSSRDHLSLSPWLANVPKAFKLLGASDRPR